MPINPALMGQAEYDKLQELLAECRKTQDYCEKCATCELDVEAEIADNANQIATVEKMLAVFFPKGRPKK